MIIGVLVGMIFLYKLPLDALHSRPGTLYVSFF